VVGRAAADWECAISDIAFRRQFPHQLESRLSLGIVHPEREAFAMSDDPREWVAEISAGLQRARSDLHLVAGLRPPPPVPGVAVDLRVQRPDMQARAVERQAGGDQPPKQLFIEKQEIVRLERVA